MNPRAFARLPAHQVVPAGRSSYAVGPGMHGGPPPRVIRRVDGLGDPAETRPALPVRMPGDSREGDAIVFFPTPTTLPTGTFYSDFYDMTAYRTLCIETGCEAIINSANGSAVLQESGDLLTWVDVTAGQAISSVGVVSEDFANLARWVRLRIIVGGTNASMTVWSKGVARER